MNQMLQIKNKLEKNLGKRVIVKANKGRKKFVTRKGILKSVYPSIFSVDVENGDELTTSTYTYSDVLTHTVRITILDDEVEFEDIKNLAWIKIESENSLFFYCQYKFVYPETFFLEFIKNLFFASSSIGLSWL